MVDSVGIAPTSRMSILLDVNNISIIFILLNEVIFNSYFFLRCLKLPVPPDLTHLVLPLDLYLVNVDEPDLVFTTLEVLDLEIVLLFPNNPNICLHSVLIFILLSYIKKRFNIVVSVVFKHLNRLIVNRYHNNNSADRNIESFFIHDCICRCLTEIV